MAAIAELSAAVGRIDRVPEDVQQLVEAHLGVVIVDLDHFAVARRAVVLVGRVLAGAAGIARHGRHDARDVVEILLDAPEAAACEDDGFFRSTGGSGNGAGHAEQGGGKNGSKHGVASPGTGSAVTYRKAAGFQFKSLQTCVIGAPGTGHLAARRYRRKWKNSRPNSGIRPTPRFPSSRRDCCWRRCSAR